MSQRWISLSQSEGARPSTAPYEGVPAWLEYGLTNWCNELFFDGSYVVDDLVDRVERELEVALDGDRGAYRLRDLLLKANQSPELFLDLTDYLLGKRVRDGIYEAASVRSLVDMLNEAGSVWTVADRNGVYRLERRVLPEIADAFARVMEPGDRAARHLDEAWTKVYGRTKDASGAYREAVRAVEAVGKTIISPANDRTTLGTMIRDLAASPANWRLTLQPSVGTAIDGLLAMMRLLWTSQLDRHGTDDEEHPLSVSDDEAEAALHLAVSLVHWFRSGAVRRV